MMELNLEQQTHKYQPHFYAGASGDFNPIHIDPEFAKNVGFERNIMHGLCTMAFVAQACVDAAGGDPRKLKRLKVRFASPLLVEQKVTISGSESGRENGLVKFAIEAKSEKGDTVISNGEAEVQIE